MDLLSKTILVAVVLVIIIAVLYYAFEKVFVPGPVTAQEASSQITSYLKEHNPNAVVNVTNVTPSTYAGSWHVVVSFLDNPNTPCPTYVVYSYDYPKYGFVNRTENSYTQDCRVIGLAGGTNYTIGSAPVAIVYSYDQNSSVIRNFVGLYGYDNIVVHAKYYPRISANNTNYSEVWIVNYSTITQANQSIYAIISQVNGTFYGTYT